MHDDDVNDEIPRCHSTEELLDAILLQMRKEDPAGFQAAVRAYHEDWHPSGG